MRGRDAGALVTGRPDCRKGPCRKASGPQKGLRGKASGPQKRALNRGSGRRPPRHSQRCPTAGCGGTEKGPKRSAIRFSNPEIPHHRKTGAIRRSGLPGYFRVTFGLHSVVIQPRGQRPTSAMPRPSTPPAAPSTPLFSFPHPSTPFNAGPFGPAALHPTGRIAFRPPAPQSRKQTSTPVFPARPHRIAPDPLHCIPPSCVAKPQTNLNHGSPVRPRRIASARSHRPHRRTSTPLQGCRRPTPVAPLSPLNASASSPLAAPLAPSRGIFAPSTRHLPPRRRGSTPIFGRRRGFSRINSYLCSAGPLCRRRLGRGRKVRATQSATQANHLISVRV